MDKEALLLLKRNCLVKATDEEYEEAYSEAVNLGYADDGGWSMNPSALIAFVDGFLTAK